MDNEYIFLSSKAFLYVNDGVQTISNQQKDNHNFIGFAFILRFVYQDLSNVNHNVEIMKNKESRFTQIQTRGAYIPKIQFIKN